MEQNNDLFNDGESPFTPVKNAAYFRAQARARLKQWWGIAILATLIAALLGATSSGFSFDWSSDYGAVADSVTREQAEQLAVAVEQMDFEAIRTALIDIFPQYAVLFPLFMMIAIVGTVFAIAFRLFVSAPIKVGYQRFQLELVDGNAAKIKVATLFDFFNRSYLKTVGLELVHGLLMTATVIPFVVGSILGVLHFAARLSALLAVGATGSAPFVMQLLGISGGLIGFTLLGAVISCAIRIPIEYMYTYAHMILADYPSVGVIEAMRMSRHLMVGKKWKLFCLEISFIGWILLASLTCGIGMIVVNPYMAAARAVFYHEITNRDAAKETEFPSIDPDDYVTR